jgi:AcrR family transcriptional regulator
MSERNKKDIIDLRKSQLIGAAYNVVSRKGYANFTIRDIAREANLSAGLVHYYFESKEDLLLTLFRQMQANLQTALEEALKAADDPVTRLRIYLDHAFSLPDREKDYIYVLFDFWSQIKHNQRIRKISRKLFTSFRSELAPILQEGQERGLFAPMDPSYTAVTILSLVLGALVQFAIDPRDFDYREYVNRQKERIVQMVTEGYTI